MGVVLTAADSPFVRLLQHDKMGVPSVEVTAALKQLRVLLEMAAAPEDVASHGTTTLWEALRSLLRCVCSEVKVTKDRRMTVPEREEWEARNACNDGLLARAVRIAGAAIGPDVKCETLHSSPRILVRSRS